MDRHRVRPHARRLPAARRPDGRPLGQAPHATDGTDTALVRLTARGRGGIRRAPDRRPGPAGLRGGASPTGRPLDPRRNFRGRRRAQSRARDLRRRHRDVGVGRGDRQWSAHRRPRLALGLLHQRSGRRPLIAMAAIFLAVDARTVRRVRRDAVRFRADRSAVPVTAGARLVGAQPHAGGGEPLGVLHVGAVFSFIFLGSLLMQQVLGYSPTRTGVAWLATSATSFMAAAITGAKLVAVVGVRRLLVAGLSLIAISALLLTRVPAGGDFATDLLPALLLAGVAGGLSAPSASTPRSG